MSQNYEELNAAWKKLTDICEKNGLIGVVKVVRDHYKHELHLERIARGRSCRRARARERDRCAKVCESRNLGEKSREDLEAQACANTIRALKDGEQ